MRLLCEIYYYAATINVRYERWSQLVKATLSNVSTYGTELSI